MRKSTSSAEQAPLSKSLSAAATPRSDEHSSSAAIRRLLIPVLSKIFSALKSPNSSASCALVSSPEGKKEVTALIAALGITLQLFFYVLDQCPDRQKRTAFF